MRICEAKNSEDYLSLTFDYEEGFSIECLKSLIKLRKHREYVRALVKNIAFADDEKYFPLQAAEMFAYGYKRSLQGNAPDYWNVLKDPMDGNTGPRCVIRYFDPGHLEKTCEQARQLQKAAQIKETK